MRVICSEDFHIPHRPRMSVPARCICPTSLMHSILNFSLLGSYLCEERSASLFWRPSKSCKHTLSKVLIPLLLRGIFLKKGLWIWCLNSPQTLDFLSVPTACFSQSVQSSAWSEYTAYQYEIGTLMPTCLPRRDRHSRWCRSATVFFSVWIGDAHYRDCVVQGLGT